ncbi:MAG: HAMP domain-containing sensor histidine kinase [Coriobacteriales bacterium]|nr:HAMP domain-containing sensor histidine kinase [Coriobacteriales bacterium]
MNAAAIAAMRRKFITIAMASFAMVILFTGGMSALANQHSLRLQTSHVLDLIIQNDGTLPNPSSQPHKMSATDIFDGIFTETAYAARYFSVLYDKHGKVSQVNVSRIATVDEQEAIRYAGAAVEAYSKSLTVSLLDLGIADTFYYRVAHLDGGETLAAFLDCSFQMQVNREVGFNTIFICLFGLAGSFVLVLVLSKRAIRPEIENARKQKQFITNASHELKTPLSVIRANTEVIEMLQGESEWTKSTMAQVDRMDGLVQNLVMIARSAEHEDRGAMSEIDVSKVIVDTVGPYRAMARQEQKELVCNVAPDVLMVAEASAIQQLCTLLVDNAIKYCDPEGTVEVELSQPKRGKVTLVVKNSFAQGKKAEFNRYFERFYRDDEAHSDAGGYGIGLSVAESICTRYGGTIRATWKGGMAIFTCQLRSA